MFIGSKIIVHVGKVQNSRNYGSHFGFIVLLLAYFHIYQINKINIA